jgi:DNA-binding IclR family transcriptional regulator
VTALLTYAVRVLRPLVSEAGEVRSASVPDAMRALGLTEPRTRSVLDDLQEAGFLTLEEDGIQPTVAGIALGVQVATSLQQTRRHELAPRKPFWTYIPEEVNLDRKRS